MTQYTYRAPAELYSAVAHRAYVERTTVSAIIREALKRYATSADVSADTQERTD